MIYCYNTYSFSSITCINIGSKIIIVNRKYFYKKNAFKCYLIIYPVFFSDYIKISYVRDI